MRANRPGLSVVAQLIAALVLSFPSAALAQETPPQVDVEPEAQTPSLLSATDGLGGTVTVGRFVLVSDAINGGIQTHDMGAATSTFVQTGSTYGLSAIEGVSFGDVTGTLIVAANQATSTLNFYRLDSVSGQLVGAGSTQPLNRSPTEITAWRAASGGLFVAAALSADGEIQQFRITAGASLLTAESVRTLNVGAAVGGIHADPTGGWLWVTVGSERGVRRYRLPADSDPADWTLIGDSLTAPAWGVSIFRPTASSAYLLVAEPATSTVALLRPSDGTVVGRLNVVGRRDVNGAEVIGPTNQARVLSFNRSPYEDGTLALGDRQNDTGPNVKLVRWNEIAAAFEPPLPPISTPGNPDPGGETPSQGGGPGGYSGGGIESRYGDESGCSAASGFSLFAALSVLGGLALRRKTRS